MNQPNSTHSVNYFIEEVETLWELASGKYGKILPTHAEGPYPASDWDKNEDTKLLNELVYTSASHPSSPISVQQWCDFFQKFEPHVRMSLISSFTNHTENTGYWGYKSQYSMPPHIVEVFSVDPDDYVRAHLARFTHLSDGVVKKMIDTFGNEPSMMLFAFLDNVTTSGERLEQVEKCIQGFPIRDNMIRQYIGDSIRTKIVKHPNLSPTLIEHYDKLYSHDLENFHKPYAELLTHPNLSEEYLQETFTKLTLAVEKEKLEHNTHTDETNMGSDDDEMGVVGVEIYKPGGTLSPANLYLYQLSKNIHFSQLSTLHTQPQV